MVTATLLQIDVDRILVAVKLSLWVVIGLSPILEGVGCMIRAPSAIKAGPFHAIIVAVFAPIGLSFLMSMVEMEVRMKLGFVSAMQGVFVLLGLIAAVLLWMARTDLELEAEEEEKPRPLAFARKL